MLITAFPMFLLVDAGSAGLLFCGLALFTTVLGLTYGPQAAWYAATPLLRDRPGIDLGIGNQAEQEVGATAFGQSGASRQG